MKKLFIILCVLLSVGFTSFASSWYWIGADSTGNQWYVDNENVYTHWITSREMSENLYDYQHGFFDSREDAVDAGYRPCRVCRP